MTVPVRDFFDVGDARSDGDKRRTELLTNLLDAATGFTDAQLEMAVKIMEILGTRETPRNSVKRRRT